MPQHRCEPTSPSRPDRMAAGSVPGGRKSQKVASRCLCRCTVAPTKGSNETAHVTFWARNRRADAVAACLPSGGSTETVAVEASGGHPGRQKIAAWTRPSLNPLPGRTIPDAEPWAGRSNDASSWSIGKTERSELLALIVGLLPVATRGHRTKGKLRWLPSTELRRSRKSVNGGLAVGPSKLASFDHLVGAGSHQEQIQMITTAIGRPTATAPPSVIMIFRSRP